MNKLKPLIYIIALFNLVAVLYLLLKPSEQKLGYFKNAEVYNGFDYKKELEAELLQFQNQNQGMLDSLEQDYKMTVTALGAKEPTEDEVIVLKRKQQGFLELQADYEKKYGEKSSEYYNQIWDRVNTYVLEYGKEHGYEYIFGANGDGSIMYAEDGQDLTQEILDFVNKKFAGA